MSNLKFGTEKIGYWGNCITISNGEVELLLTTDVGPRIMRYRFTDGKNMLYEHEDTLGEVGGADYNFFGGHRLWHSPQDGDRCSEPDNGKIDREVMGDTVVLRQAVEPLARIEKHMEVTLSTKGTEVTILHRLINRNPWPIELAAWGLTTLPKGGLEIMPWTDRKPPDYYPNTALAFWPWSKPNDHRLSFGDNFMTLEQVPENSDWFKMGYPNTAGWAAYILDDLMFVKKYKHIPGGKYPDYDSSFATFTYDIMLEMETLSPLKMLAPGRSIEHEEKWFLFNNISTPSNEEEIERKIFPVIKNIL